MCHNMAVMSERVGGFRPVETADRVLGSVDRAFASTIVMISSEQAVLAARVLGVGCASEQLLKSANSFAEGGYTAAVADALRVLAAISLAAGYPWVMRRFRPLALQLQTDILGVGPEEAVINDVSPALGFLADPAPIS